VTNSPRIASSIRVLAKEENPARKLLRALAREDQKLNAPV